MIWLNFVLLVFISIYCSAASNICYEEFPETEIDDDVSCIQRDTGQIENDRENVTCELDSNITMTVVDSQAGILSVEFKLAPSSCKYIEYDVKLYIEESIRDEKSCAELTFIEDIHSERVLMAFKNQIGKRKLPYCKDTEKLIFYHVYTGCYVLRIKANGSYEYKGPTYIETKHPKTTLIDKLPNISSQYLPQEKELDVDIQFDSFRDLRLCLYISDNVKVYEGDPCIKTGIMHTACQHMRGGNFMCRARNKKTFNSSTLCHFDKSGDKMSCTIKNVTSGTYCVLMQIYDDRCKQDTVWHKGDLWKCLFNTVPINVTAVYGFQHTTVKEHSSASPVFEIVISVVAVLGLISLGVLLFLWLRGRPKPKLVFQPNKVTRSQQKPSIVLLYALDCKPFMTLMSMFRDILREITKCEVYDYFDPERAEEIALNKTDWLRKRMEFSKIVLVENRCAVLHQKALFEQSRLIYKDTVSVSVDDLFLYGLKMLTDDCFGRSMYERVLVVRIEGFTETKDVLSHVAPLIRYAIPQHMEQLLSSLYQVESQHYENQIAALGLPLTSQSEYEMDNRMLKFIECLKNLENYKTEKPEYLNNMFVKQCIK